jgi:sec-independent protein translocase protein TatA
MGTLGVPEMIAIFLVALVLFGPKELPKLGRTLGKALTEFRRASSDLKSSFEREMQTLERETDSFKDATHGTVTDLAKHLVYDPDFNDDDNGYTPVVHAAPAAITPSTVGASDVSGAESHGTSETASSEAASIETAGTIVATLPPVEGTVPRSESNEPAQQHS